MFPDFETERFFLQHLNLT